MSGQAIRIMLVEDHQLMREVLELVLSREPDFEVVGSAADVGQAVALLCSARPDVVLMDLDLPGPDGVRATRAMLRIMPGLRVIMLSATCTPAHVDRALSAGACGYLIKDGSVEQLRDGVRTAARGGRPMAPLAAAMHGSDVVPTTGPR